MTLYKWSNVAATNGLSDSSCPWPEGMPPSQVNDSARGMMAATAKYRDDTAGLIATGGTSTNYTVASNQGFASLTAMHGQEIAFTPHVTNGATVTLNVDGLGAQPLRAAPSTELLAGVLIQGTPYSALYNRTDQVFYLRGIFGNPFNIPLAGGMDYWGTTVPNSAFAFPIGQEISRTTYAALFAIMGTTYGVGDGLTTFRLPDKTGRVSAMKEGTASRITTAGSGIDGATMGAAGGTQNVILAANQIPSLTSSGSNNISVGTGVPGFPNIPIATIGVNPTSVDASGLTTAIPQSQAGTWQSVQAFTGANAITVNYINGAQALVNKMPPLIVCNYILRVL